MLHPTPRPRRALPAVAVVLALLVLAGCRVQARVDVAMATDGSGTVTVAVGLDADALGRLGDPATALRTDDLVQAGWAVTGPEPDEAGVTWWRATKAFATPDELALVLAEVAGPEGPVRDLALTVGETSSTDTYRLTGTVDLSAGLAPYGDPALAEALGGDPFGGLVAAVEAEEGRPVSELVDVTVAVGIGDEVQVLSPRLGDPPQAVDVTEEVAKPTSRLLWLAAGALVVVLVGLLAVGARRRAAQRWG